MNLDFFLDNVAKIIRYCQIDENEPGIDVALREIKEVYEHVSDKKEFMRQILVYIDRDLALYSLILSALYDITKDSQIVSEIEQLLYEDDLDVFQADSILRQVRRLKFLDYNLEDSYETYRKIGEKITDRFKNQYLSDITFTPYKERNKKRIVIATDQLLGERHAPTKIVLKLCAYLMRDYGYEVFLLVNLTNSNMDEIQELWCQPIKYASNSQLDGVFQLRYEDVLIRGFQFAWRKEKVEDILAACSFIQEWKPLCVYYVGGTSFRHDIYRFFTTMIAMQCTDGYSISDAQVIASYMHSNSEYVQKSIEYIKMHKQIIEDIQLMGTLKEESGRVFKKEYYGIPENSFLLSIVGNRLDSEMTKEFVDMLEELLEEREDVYVACIGDCERRYFQEKYSDKVLYLGYQNELVDVMKMMDLFVNPPRKGGGGGALFAMQAEVPVATLINNDVANAVDEASCCSDLRELKTLIIKYMEQPEFYQSQVTKCKEWKDKREKNTDSKSYGDLLNRLNDLLEMGAVE